MTLGVLPVTRGKARLPLRDALRAEAPEQLVVPRRALVVRDAGSSGASPASMPSIISHQVCTLPSSHRNSLLGVTVLKSLSSSAAMRGSGSRFGMPWPPPLSEWKRPVGPTEVEANHAQHSTLLPSAPLQGIRKVETPPGWQGSNAQRQTSAHRSIGARTTSGAPSFNSALPVRLNLAAAYRVVPRGLPGPSGSRKPRRPAAHRASGWLARCGLWSGSRS